MFHCLPNVIETNKNAIFFFFFLEYLANNEAYFSHFLSIFEAKDIEYFQGACHHFLVPATEVPKMVQVVFSMELLVISCLKLGLNTKFVLELPADLQRVFEQYKIT